MRFYNTLNTMMLALLVSLLPAVAAAQLPPRNVWLRMCGAELESKMRSEMPGAVFERDLEGSGVSMREWSELCAVSAQCALPNEDVQTERAPNVEQYWRMNYCGDCFNRATERARWLASAYDLDAAVAHPPASLRTALRRWCDAQWMADAARNTQWPERARCYDGASCDAALMNHNKKIKAYNDSILATHIHVREQASKWEHAVRLFWRNWLRINKPSKPPHEEKIDPLDQH